MKITRWLADMKPSTEDIRSMLEDEGLELEVETYEPPAQVKEHFHAFDEVRMIAAGTLRYNVDGNEFLLRVGDRIELPSNTRHWTRAEGDVPCVSFLAHRVS